MVDDETKARVSSGARSKESSENHQLRLHRPLPNQEKSIQTSCNLNKLAIRTKERDFGAKEYDKYNPWFWIDVETSGLRPEHSQILEMAIVVTDSNLVVWDSLSIVLHHPAMTLMTNSSQWCKRHFRSRSHGGNGLFDDCNFSTTTKEEASRLIWNFFEYYSSHEIGKGRPRPMHRQFFDKTLGANGANLTNFDLSSSPYSTRRPHHQVILAGSTVHFDRKFLEFHFPFLTRFISHKNVDVTTLLETVKRFRSGLLSNKPKPAAKHRAMPDILDSIELLRYFRKEIIEK